MSNAQIKIQNKKSADEISFLKILIFLRKNWFWIPIFLIISISLAMIYLRYTKPLYRTIGTVKIENSRSSIDQLNMSDMMFNSSSSVKDEILALQSYTLVETAIKKMAVPVSYFRQGNVIRTELYSMSPFDVIYDQKSTKPNYNLYTVKIKDLKSYILEYLEGPDEVSMSLRFGEKVNISGFEFMIILNQNKLGENLVNEELMFQLNREEDLVARARNGLQISEAGNWMSVINISHVDHTPKFSEDLINSLIIEYMSQDVIYRRQAAEQAVEFIDTQLDTLQKQVEVSQNKIRRFQEGGNFIGLEQKAQMDFTKFQTLQDEKTDLLMKIDHFSEIEILVGNNSDNLDMTFLSIDDAIINRLGGLLVSLKKERQGISQTYQDDFPMIKEIEIRESQIKQAMLDRISQVKNDFKIKEAYLETEIKKYDSKLSRIPASKKDWVNLEREYTVKEDILKQILSKKTEAAIARASIVPFVRIVDKARAARTPFSPDKIKILALSFVAGITLGFTLVMILGFMYNTISSREEIESQSDVPIIGTVTKVRGGVGSQYPKMLVLDSPKSSFSESLRSIRSNIGFIRGDNENLIIAISSTISGEGKSFIALNLAGIISLLGKKVVIVDMDLRKPKMHKSFELNNSIGLSTYLVGKSDLDDVIWQSGYDNLDIITCGPIPPNPSEIIQSKEMDKLFVELRRRYDFVIIDTPPVGLVTDATILFDKTDVNFFVIRANYSRWDFARVPDRLREQISLEKKLFVILNSVDNFTQGYGAYGSYSYGNKGYYGYHSDYELPPWWQFWRRMK